MMVQRIFVETHWAKQSYVCGLSFKKYLTLENVLLVEVSFNEIQLKISSFNEPFSEEGSTDTKVNKNTRSTNDKNVKYAIFDPSGLKSELDKYKEEVKKLRKENYGLKIKNQSLRNEKNKLSKKVEIREKLMELYA